MAFWTIAYQHGWATKAQLGQAVAKGLITAADYKTITGEDYNV
ncbi:XkdX family protein [Faecalispora anaeroviscerum]|nr:XkdX family protein [Faecalispora anaeroviscerum]